VRRKAYQDKSRVKRVKKGKESDRTLKDWFELKTKGLLREMRGCVRK
jgi:hypothetical protein